MSCHVVLSQFEIAETQRALLKAYVHRMSLATCKITDPRHFLGLADTHQGGLKGIRPGCGFARLNAAQQRAALRSQLISPQFLA